MAGEKERETAPPLLSISLVSSNTTVTSESLRVGKFSGAVRGWKAWQHQLCDGAADVTRRLSDTVISHISVVVRDDVYQSLEISRQARKVCSSSELVEASAGPSPGIYMSMPRIHRGKWIDGEDERAR